MRFSTGLIAPLAIQAFAGVIIIVVAVTTLNVILIIASMLLATPIYLSSAVVEVDTSGKRYRKGISYLGLVLGKWKAIPEAEYVELLRTPSRHSGGIVNAGKKDKRRSASIIYSMAIIPKSGKAIPIVVFGDYETGMEFTNQLGKALSVPGKYRSTF